MNALETLLWPLTIPYGAATRLRAQAYAKRILHQRRLDGTVISVGNLTVGGTGKTPMVLWIAERLIGEGKKTGILTRGYRGEASANGSTSDEVRLLRARLGDRVLFGIGENRWVRGRELSEGGVEWFILDDGFQHLQLARDVEVVLIDATNPFGGGHLLPAGRLREPRSALRRADIVVITRADHAPALEVIIRHHTAAPIFYARTELGSISSAHAGDPPDATARERKLFAFCAIGNPKAFLEDLRAWGFDIVGHAFFQDHHRFSPGDIEMIEGRAKAAGATTLICSEKDLHNLARCTPSMDLFVCRISLQIARDQDFWTTLKRIAGASRRERTGVDR